MKVHNKKFKVSVRIGLGGSFSPLKNSFKLVPHCMHNTQCNGLKKIVHEKIFTEQIVCRRRRFDQIYQNFKFSKFVERILKITHLILNQTKKQITQLINVSTKY